MRFLLDESADYPLAALLTELGHDVRAIAHDYPGALKDSQVLKIAHQEQRILITNDRDFGELVFRRSLPHSGIVLFRLAEEDIPSKMRWLQYVLNQFAAELGNFIVISQRGVRVRRTH